MDRNQSMKRNKKKLKEQPVFLARISELLKEGYTFPQAIHLILPHHTKYYEEWHEEIEDAFKKGLGATDVLQLLKFPDTVLLSVMIAEKNGHLAEVLGNIAEQLKNIDEATKKFKSLLTYPIALFLFVGGLLMAFRQFFLPNMKALSYQRQADASMLSNKLPDLVALLPDIIISIVLLSTLVIGMGTYHYHRCKPEEKIKFINRLPMLRDWIFQWKSQHFARELGSLLESGVSMQDALDVLIDQTVDPLLSEISKQIKSYLIYGESFPDAIALTDGLTKEFSTFAKHGEASGHLAKELLIYSKHLEEAIRRKMTKGLSLLQPILFSVIALCIMAAYIALLLPIYNMLDTI